MPQLHNADPLLILAIVLVVGVMFGTVARRLRVPAITGQILGGILIGRLGLQIFNHDSVAALAPITHFALGLMAVTVGAHLNFGRLRNAGKRLGFLILFEAILIPAFVFGSLSFFPEIDWSMALLFGTVAISTAPATIVAVVKETRSKGVFVKTLVAAVALNNLVCISLFELARHVAHRTLGATDIPIQEILLGSLVHLLQAAVTGMVAALAMALMFRFVRRTEILTTAGFIAILLTVGMANYMGYSPLLACLFLGLAQTNVTHDRSQVVDVIFSDMEPAILVIFFTLAGMELTLEHAGQIGLIAGVFLVARGAGKFVAGDVAMRLAGATDKLRRNIGPALIPQAGVAVGLVVLLENDPILRQAGSARLDLFAAVVITAVVVNEIVGPIFTRTSLARSGEVGHDRMRLMDFIHEENILVDFNPANVREAVEHLSGLLVSTNNLQASERDGLIQSVLERESEVSTCIGGGLSVPHGIRSTGQELVGAMGISRKGLAFDTPDEGPIHCVVLLASPPDELDRHLQILATLARAISFDAVVSAQLFNAKSPAHAYEILHVENAEDFNYFLEDLA